MDQHDADHAAEIVREYGPFPASTTCTASPTTAEHVWFATGDTLNAIDPASGKTVRSIDVAGARRHGVRRRAPVPDRRGSHPEDRSGDRPRARDDSGARRRRRLGARVGRGHALGRAVSRPQDPSDRSRDRRDPAHDRVEPLRHRRDLGRRRALARHLGRRRERPAAHRSAHGRGARAARDAGRSRRVGARVRRRRSVLLRRRQQRQGAGRPPAEARPDVYFGAGVSLEPIQLLLRALADELALLGRSVGSESTSFSDFSAASRALSRWPSAR